VLPAQDQIFTNDGLADALIFDRNLVIRAGNRECTDKSELAGKDVAISRSYSVA